MFRWEERNGHWPAGEKVAVAPGGAPGGASPEVRAGVETGHCGRRYLLRAKILQNSCPVRPQPGSFHRWCRARWLKWLHEKAQQQERSRAFCDESAAQSQYDCTAHHTTRPLFIRFKSLVSSGLCVRVLWRLWRHRRSRPHLAVEIWWAR
jgi:hypothetical protein